MSAGGDRRERHVVVVGAGITGLAAARALLTATHAPRVTVLESDTRLGGKIRTSPFAGLPAVDEGADAYLTRVPWAMQMAREVGLEHRLTWPAGSSAAVWHGRLHRLPAGLVLGLPSAAWPLLRSRVVSVPGALRAALEPLKARSSTDDDSLGRLVRERFGDEVHERLVDPLIGSIYAADTDRFSLRAVGQVHELATQDRSLMRAARRQLARQRSGPPAVHRPVFEAPIGGMSELIEAVAATVSQMGGTIRLGDGARWIEPDGGLWRVNGEVADAVILATSAHDAVALLGRAAPSTVAGLGGIEYADVAIVALAVPSSTWPAHLTQDNGYLVARDVQRRVTAVSFGSTKWAHWRPPDGRILLRVSLGRDGAPIDDLDDRGLLEAAVIEVGRQLKVDLQPSAVRVTRWRRAFAQYRPHHTERVDAIERALAVDAPGIFVAGASYRGIGIPACVHQGSVAGGAAIDHVRSR